MLVIFTEILLNTTRDTSLNAAQPSGTALIVAAVSHFAFFLASILAIPLLARGSRIPNPFGLDADTRAFLHTAAAAVRVADFLQLASALCLAVLGALLAERLRSTRTYPSPSLTLIGSLGAAAMLSVSALTSWAMAAPGTTDWGLSFHSLQFLPFLFGGPGWAGFFAIFLASASAGATGHVPGWMTASGYALASVSALATVTLLTIFASPCLPIARFLGFVWLILIAAYAARQRR
jgi:hypothetical protein